MLKRSLLTITASISLLGASCPFPPVPPTPSPVPTPTPTPLPTPTPTPTPLPSPTPSPSPSPLNCPDPPNWGPALGKTVSDDVRVALESRINAALLQMGYSDGQLLEGDCNVAAETFYTRLQATVRANGTCAYHVPDAFHIVIGDGSLALDHHMINFGACRLRYASSENYKGDWRLLNSAPTPLPSPTNAPSPSPSNCPVNINAGSGYWIEPRVGPIGGSTKHITVTPYYCGFPVRSDVFGSNCGTKCCKLGVDGGDIGVACESALFGTPIWSGPAVPWDSNPFNATITGAGTIGVQGSNCPVNNPCLGTYSN